MKIFKILSSMLAGLLVVIILILLPFGVWYLKREINWNYGYESQVTDLYETRIKNLENKVQELQELQKTKNTSK